MIDIKFLETTACEQELGILAIPINDYCSTNKLLNALRNRRISSSSLKKSVIAILLEYLRQIHLCLFNAK